LLRASVALSGTTDSFDFAQAGSRAKPRFGMTKWGLAAIMSMSFLRNLPAPLPDNGRRRRALGKNLWLAAAIAGTTMMLIHAAPSTTA